MSRRTGITALLAPAAAAVLAAAPGPWASASDRARSTAVRPAALAAGKRLYRTYCGQCHVLTQALAVGFGSDNGLGEDGGPSFDFLRVPFVISVAAVTTPSVGHDVVSQRMTWTEVKQVARFVEIATRRHPRLVEPIERNQ